MHALRGAPDVSPLLPGPGVVATLRDAGTDAGPATPAGSRGAVVAVCAGGAACGIAFARPAVGTATLRAGILAAA